MKTKTKEEVRLNNQLLKELKIEIENLEVLEQVNIAADTKDIRILEILSHNGNKYVKEGVAKNPLTTSDILEQLVINNGSLVQLAISERKDLRAEVVIEIIRRGNDTVRKEILETAKICLENLKEYLKAYPKKDIFTVSNNNKISTLETFIKKSGE